MGTAERRQRDRERRSREILAAAERVFIEQGFEPSTMDDIARAAEISKGTVYLYFESKDALFAAIGERVLVELVQDLDQALAGEQDAVAAMRKVFELYHAFLNQRPEHTRLILRSAFFSVRVDPTSPSFEGLRTQISALVHRITRVIDLGKAQGVFRADLDSMTLYLHLWSGVLGLWTVLLNGDEVNKRLPEAVDLDQLFECFVKMNLSALQDRSALQEQSAAQGSALQDRSETDRGRALKARTTREIAAAPLHTKKTAGGQG